MSSSNQHLDLIVIKDFGDDLNNNSPEIWFSDDSDDSFQNSLSKFVDRTIERLSICDENSKTVLNNNLESAFRTIEQTCTLKPGTFYKRQDLNLEVNDDISRFIQNHEKPTWKVAPNAGSSETLVSDDNINDLINLELLTQDIYSEISGCDIFNDIFTSSQENSQNYLEEDKCENSKSRIVEDDNVARNDMKPKKSFRNSQKSTEENLKKKKKGLGVSETSKLIKKSSESSKNSKFTEVTYSKVFDNFIKEINIQKTKSKEKILFSKEINVSSTKKTKKTMTRNLPKKSDKNRSEFQLAFESWLKNSKK